MTNDDFIISTLNLKANDIKELTCVKIDGVLHFNITLNSKDNECPYCGGKTRIKDYSKLMY